MAYQKKGGHGGDRKSEAFKSGQIGPAPRQSSERAMKSVSVEAIAELIEASKRTARVRPRTRDWCPYIIDPLKGAIEPHKDSGVPTLAMDDTLMGANAQVVDAWLASGMMSAAASEGLVFFGYPYLSELAQRPEYRTFAETLSTEMTRKWVRFKGTAQKDEEERDAGDPEAALRIRKKVKPNGPASRSTRVGDDDKGERIKELTDYQEHLKLRSAFCEAAKYDFFMGRSHLLLDCQCPDDELKSPIGTGRDETTAIKVGRDWLKGIRNIEAIWCYPQAYNASNPLAPDWYRPEKWYVLGREIHRTRLLPFIGRPVPDMLKPAYSFGGLSMSQMAEPYVTIWLQTRQSVAEMIRSYSTMVLLTDLAVVLQAGAGGANLLARASLYNTLRDNQGLFIGNKDTEDIKNVAAPLSGLHELQAQSQEHMMSVARIPAIIFTGIQPAGLSSTSEGELKAFEQTIAALQQQTLDPNFVFVNDVSQMSLWGERDPDLTHEWIPLRSLSEKEQAELRKLDAETGAIHIDSGAIWQEEERRRIANDPNTLYPDLDVEDVPDLAAEEEAGLEPLGKPSPFKGGGGGEGGGRDAVVPFAGTGDLALDAAVIPLLDDAGAHDLLGYLDGIAKVSLVPDASRWNAHYDLDRDEIVFEGKTEARPSREQLEIMLHEAGHRGGLKVDRRAFRAFRRRGFDALRDFLSIANEAHLRDFRRRGVVDGVTQELFAQSYANYCLGEPLPPEVAAFWRERCAGFAADEWARPAAGVMFTTPGNHALFLRWAPGHARAGEWSLPGGRLEDGERPEDAARRETGEETGWMLSDSDYLPLLNRNGDHGGDYWTFKHPIKNPFEPRLSDEHDAHEWRHVGDPPRPLHPGVEHLLRAGYMPSSED